MKYPNDPVFFDEDDFRDDAYKIRQVKIFILIFVGLFFLVIFNVSKVYADSWLPEVWAAIFFLIFLIFFVSVDTTNIVTGMATWTGAVLTLSLAWRYDGLHDSTLLLFPCILLFAAIFGGKILLISLFLYMLGTFYLLAYAEHAELIASRSYFPSDIWVRARTMSILLGVYGLGSLRLSSYVRLLIVSLHREKTHSDQVQAEADRRILIDSLTDLPNEAMCKKELFDILKESKRKKHITGFISISINNIAWINSSLGGDIGDRTLQVLSDRFQKLTDENIRVYRNSGPDFIFLVCAKDNEVISDFSHQLLRSTFRSISLQDYDIEVICSLGIAVAPYDGDTFSELLRKSNTALYKSSKEEPNSLRFFENDMDAQANHRLTMVYQLKRAIDQNEFELYYQPKIDLNDNTVVGAEALIRWYRKSDAILVNPSEFIPIAEESGLISEIGKWIIETACSECARWSSLRLPRLSVAINLSPIQFKRGNLPSQVFRALKRVELDPNLLELEITESLFIEDEEHVKNQIYTMSEKGINFAIDDFGTGYSNLNYLAKFNASTLKIDMSFIKSMMSSDQHLHIVNAVIKMSTIMELENVAEGVEDEASMKKLQELGCMYGQGYYWSKPLSADQFIHFVNQWDKK